MKHLIAYILTIATLSATWNCPLHAELMAPKTTHYNNDSKNYEVDYPSSWQKKEIPNLDLFLFAPLKNSQQQAPASVNIISEKIGTDVNVNKFYADSIANLVKELKDVKIEKSGDQKIGNATAKWIQYTHQIQSINFRVMQFFLVENGYLYLITYSAPLSEFDTHKPEFDSMTNSMRFKTPAEASK